jgi:hypothetical protein
MVQKTRGHASPPLIGNLQQFPFGVVCPFFSTEKSTHQPDEPVLIYNMWYHKKKTTQYSVFPVVSKLFNLTISVSECGT